jgi:hypothetical protein
MGLLLLDFANAFNACSRARILERAYSDARLKPLWGILHLTLGAPTAVRLFDRGKPAHVGSSRQGVRQGAVLAPLAFALLVDSGIRDLHKRFSSVAAYLDDVTVLVRRSHVDAAGGIDAYVRDIMTSFSGTQLALNARKTVLLLRPGLELSATPATCEVRHLCTRLLGGAVGWRRDSATRQAISKWMTDKAESMVAYFALAEQLSNPLLKLIVARLALEPRIGYLLRVTPAELCCEAVAKFDRALRAFTLKTCGAQDDDNRADCGWSLMRLPEGLGVRSAADIVAADAYGSSRRQEKEFHATFVAQQSERRALLVSTLTPKQKAIVTASSTPLASLWRRPAPWRTPVLPKDTPPTVAVQSALRHTLLLPDEHRGSICHTCGSVIDDNAIGHALTSNHGKRTAAHSGVQQALRGVLKDLGLAPSMKEKAATDVGSNERPDIDVAVGNVMWALEVMTPCPAAARWAAHSGTPQGVANAACAAKERDYEFLRSRGVSVAGIVVDTCGGIAENTLKFLAQVVRDQTPEIGEWAARVEAAVVRLQFGMITGLQTAVFDQIRQTEVWADGRALPQLLPLVGPATADCAARDLRATVQ